MKKLNVRILLILFLLITFISSFSSASYNNVTMSVVEEPICTINFGTNSFVERSIISKDLDNKEITLQLKAVNNEESLKPTGEIMLVIDNSKSMLDLVSNGKTREDLVIESAKSLISNLLEDNSKLKIGVVSFSTNSDISKEGSLEDAKIVSELTNNIDSLISSVSSIQYDGPRTNLNAGISLAKQYFSDETDNAHKYVIVLSDGVPNVAVNYDKNYYSDDVISKTKSELESLSSVADNVIVMLTGISNGTSIASPSTKTYDQIISEIFGTTLQPTIGKFYYIADDKIEETIKSDIYEDLLPISQSFTNLKIVDYFTDEIVNNFSFSYVKEPNLGTISEQIDKLTNSITWTIPELKSGETAIVQYKLKLNENYDSNIVDKILNTNSKLDLTYTDFSNKTDTKTSDITPKVKLVEPEVKEDLPKVLPKAGSTTLFGIIGLIIIVAFISGIRYFFIRNKLK